MIYVIYATDGCETQTMKLKIGTTIERANEILEDLIENDYLGLEYWIESYSI